MYNKFNQYRCIIIRGKSQTEIDDLLPAYAKIIDEITPCESDEFKLKFNKYLVPYLASDKRAKKTLDNHRTEIAGKLFGMYYLENNGYIYASERTQKFLKDNDQPAFFKDICYKMQFPNGMQKIKTIQELIDHKIAIRPNSFVLRVLELARYKNIILTKKEIGYYVLNSLDVLQGISSPEEVMKAIEEDRDNKIKREIEVEGKAESYKYQHIKEQMNYLELANLVYTDKENIWLNEDESDTIKTFSAEWNKKPIFDVYGYNLKDKKDKEKFKLDWQCYFSRLSDKAKNFETTVNSLGVSEQLPEKRNKSTVEIGDEGELVVFEYEKARVQKFNPRLVNRVLSLGKIKGLGYDIQSVVAEDGEKSDFTKYIEVKSTKRVTKPDFNNMQWMDAFNITRNEWIAAQQHGEYYSIYRVYFIRNEILIYKIDNIYEKIKEKRIEIVPLTYRINFGIDVVDPIMEKELKNNA